ncbi:hypothetical protein [Aliivibrio finisterrensis]|uniref:Uncharacterized protein n=1 Tax=Aliivibrio finisterrensis TaxID=511998 RepID=A0ABY0IA90_9GAMM|nr:hypothetical protein [Aliivibrio finisterrensis]RYU64343.1 hypothetical protein ERW53_10420 [Aliivibrio finisterrensis]RYU83955.1 hypothetical protein ERW52_12260 [Aliivibrio finisterrensis]
MAIQEQRRINQFLHTAAQARIQYGEDKIRLTPMAKTTKYLFEHGSVSREVLDSSVDGLPLDEKEVWQEVLTHLDMFR